MALVALILASVNELGFWDHQNSQLELASKSLEVRVTGEDISELSMLYLRQCVKTSIRPGVFRRSPGSDMANSHDNIVFGVAVSSMLHDNGAVARQILKSGPLYISGVNEHGHIIDWEWFMLMRPDYRGFLKVMAGIKPHWWEDKAMRLNMLYSKAFNIKRVQIMALYAAGYYHRDMETAIMRLGEKYKGRYLADRKNPTLPIYKAAWAANEGKFR